MYHYYLQVKETKDRIWVVEPDKHTQVLPLTISEAAATADDNNDNTTTTTTLKTIQCCRACATTVITYVKYGGQFFNIFDYNCESIMGYLPSQSIMYMVIIITVVFLILNAKIRFVLFVVPLMIHTIKILEGLVIRNRTFASSQSCKHIDVRVHS
jgi:hypothetical protein